MALITLFDDLEIANVVYGDTANRVGDIPALVTVLTIDGAVLLTVICARLSSRCFDTRCLISLGDGYLQIDSELIRLTRSQ